MIHKVAFPFAQGKLGKLDSKGRALGQQLALFDDDDPNLSERDWNDLLDWLEAVGRSWGKGGAEPQARRLVAHNAAFDLIMTEAGTMARPGVGQKEWRGRDLSRWAWCSQVTAKELWPDKPIGLEAVGERIFGNRGKKISLKGHTGPKDNLRYDLIDWEALFKRYVLQDVDIGLLVATYELDMIDQGMGIRPWIRNEQEAMRTLLAMERRGLPYAARESLEVAQRLAKKQKELEAALPFKATGPAAKQFFFTDRVSVVDRPGGGPGGGPNGTAHAGAPIADAGGRVGGRVRTQGLNLTPYSVTDKGAPQLTEEHVQRLITDFGPDSDAGRVASVWRDWTKLETARTMWYSGYAERIGPDGRLRTRFNQHGTRSERYSVSRVNLQAIPQDWRMGGDEGVLAGEPTPRALITQAIEQLKGWGGWELDYAQAELRSAAYKAECKAMMRQIEAGEDLHGYTAKGLFPKLDERSKEWPFVRGVIGKRANFTLIFGAGWRTYKGMLSKEGVDQSDRECKRQVNTWKEELFPEFERAIDKWSRFAERHRYVPLVNGKRRWFAAYEDRHKAFNQLIQGSLAELGKLWMIDTERHCRKLGLDERGLHEGVGRGGLLLVIHDSQVLLLPDDGAAGIAKTCAGFGKARWDQLFPRIPGGVDIKEWGKK